MSPAAPAWPAARAEQVSAVCTRCGGMSEPPAASFGRVAPTSAHSGGDTDRRRHRPAEIRGRRRHGQRQLETQTAAEAERKERQRPRRRFRSRSEAVRKWPRGGAVPTAVPRRFRGSSEAARKEFRSNSEVVRFWGGSEAVRFRCVSEAGLTRSQKVCMGSRSLYKDSTGVRASIPRVWTHMSEWAAQSTTPCGPGSGV